MSRTLHCTFTETRFQLTRTYCYTQTGKYYSLLQYLCVRLMPMLGTFRWEWKKQETTKTRFQVMFGHSWATQTGRVGSCIGQSEPSQCWRETRKALRASLLPSSCKAHTQPEQILGKTTEWKRRRKDPSRIVSTAAIANNCFPLTALTVKLHYSSD